jgi:ABC-type cobalamin/Fe3+-siderophores transport system ATPase subunit
VNVVLLGPNGVGKTMLLRNLAHRALHEGHAVVVRSASCEFRGIVTTRFAIVTTCFAIVTTRFAGA